MVVLLFYAFFNANPQNSKSGKKPKKQKRQIRIKTKFTIREKLMKRKSYMRKDTNILSP